MAKVQKVIHADLTAKSDYKRWIIVYATCLIPCALGTIWPYYFDSGPSSITISEAISIVITLPGLVLTLLVEHWADWLLDVCFSHATTGFALDSFPFGVSTALLSSAFWTLVLLGLRAFFVRAYEVLK